MAKRIERLEETKKKPWILLVYLALENCARSKPMNREDVAEYIKKNFHVRVAEKTISDCADVFRSLSVGEHPLMDFHSCGKSGYLLGSRTSLLTKAEALRILACFSEISAETGDRLFDSLKPYLSDEDAKTVRIFHEATPRRKDIGPSDGRDYLGSIETICEAIEQRREVSFLHRYADSKGVRVKEEEVSIVPFYLFAFKGRYFLLGGKTDGIKRSDGKQIPTLYIADVSHMAGAAVSEKPAMMTIANCRYGKKFELQSHLRHVVFLREGIFHPAGYHGYLAKIYSEKGLLLTEMMYGDCFEVVSPGDQSVPYRVRLNMDFATLISWALFFTGRRMGQLEMRPGTFEEEWLRRILYRCAKEAASFYGAALPNEPDGDESPAE